MTNRHRDRSRRPLRVWVLGLVIGMAAGAASIYLLAQPRPDGTVAGTIADPR